MTDNFTPELWLTATAAETYAGLHLTTLDIARALIAQSRLDPTKQQDALVLDIGTGLGAVPEAFYQLSPSPQIKVVASDVDRDGSLLPALDAKIKANGWESKVETSKLDVMDLKTPDDHFDYAFANLVYMLIPKPVEALKETIRTLKPAGQLAFSTWADPGAINTFRLAAALIPAFPNLRTIESAQREYGPGYWHDAAFVRKALEDLGLVDIQVETRLMAPGANTAAALARQLWSLAKIFAGALGGGEVSRVEGWKLFGKVEEILTLQFGDGPVNIAGAVLLVTARKPE